MYQQCLQQLSQEASVLGRNMLIMDDFRFLETWRCPRYLICKSNPQAGESPKKQALLESMRIRWPYALSCYSYATLMQGGAQTAQ